MSVIYVFFNLKLWNPFFPGFSASTCFLQPIDIFYCIAEGSKTTRRNTLYKSFLSPYLGDECLFFFSPCTFIFFPGFSASSSFLQPIANFLLHCWRFQRRHEEICSTKAFYPHIWVMSAFFFFTLQILILMRFCLLVAF